MYTFTCGPTSEHVPCDMERLKMQTPLDISGISNESSQEGPRAPTRVCKFSYEPLHHILKSPRPPNRAPMIAPETVKGESRSFRKRPGPPAQVPRADKNAQEHSQEFWTTSTRAPLISKSSRQPPIAHKNARGRPHELPELKCENKNELLRPSEASTHCLEEPHSQNPAFPKTLQESQNNFEDQPHDPPIVPTSLHDKQSRTSGIPDESSEER